MTGWSSSHKDLFFKKCYNYCINKIFWSKHKRVVLVAFAVIFLVALFLWRNGLPWKNKGVFEGLAKDDGLLYENELIEDVVRKDTDGDGILDWEETLWGLDPASKETTPGTPDMAVVNKLRAENGEYGTGDADESENLTETDKFSRELFSTIASLNQSGALDAATVDVISQSLSEKVQNPAPKKIYSISDIKVTSDNSAAAVKKYSDALNTLYKTYPIRGNVLDIIDKFVLTEDETDITALAGLDSIMKDLEARMGAALKIEVPSSFADTSLQVLNSAQRILENLENIRAFETDPVLTLGALVQYDQNTTALMEASAKLTAAIKKTLSQ